jgi:hypothetical protein
VAGNAFARDPGIATGGGRADPLGGFHDVVPLSDRARRWGRRNPWADQKAWDEPKENTGSRRPSRVGESGNATSKRAT